MNLSARFIEHVFEQYTTRLGKVGLGNYPEFPDSSQGGRKYFSVWEISDLNADSLAVQFPYLNVGVVVLLLVGFQGCFLGQGRAWVVCGMPGQGEGGGDAEGTSAARREVMQRGTPSHPKIKTFARCLRIPLPLAVGYIKLLWDFTAQYQPDSGGDWSVANPTRPPSGV